MFGGGREGSNFTTSNITMESGTVRYIIAGGLSTNEKEISKVTDANIIINGGTITNSLEGGGQGYSYVGTSNITINDGNLSKAYVTAGGSNGYTNDANVEINGGKIYLYQSVNRGIVDNATAKVNGGIIDKFYVGGETEDTQVNGEINNVTISLLAGNITNLNLGTSNDEEIKIDNENHEVIKSKDFVIKNDNIQEGETEINYEINLPEKIIILEGEKNK